MTSEPPPIGLRTGTPRVKICGLRRREDVLAADAAGADYVGVILSAGFDRSVVERDAPALTDGVVATPVAVLVDESADTAERLARSLSARVLQLHGEEPPALLEELGRRGSWTLWKSIRVAALDDVRRAVAAYGDVAHGLLLEGRREGVIGGGGVRLEVDGAAVRALIPRGIDFVLAGGLTPVNVAEAVARAAPDVVDVSSGVERTRGEKDHERIRRFAAHARGGSAGT